MIGCETSFYVCIAGSHSRQIEAVKSTNSYECNWWLIWTFPVESWRWSLASFDSRRLGFMGNAMVTHTCWKPRAIFWRSFWTAMGDDYQMDTLVGWWFSVFKLDLAEQRFPKSRSAPVYNSHAWATALFRSAATAIRVSFRNAISLNYRNVVTYKVVCVFAYLPAFPPIWSKMMEEEDSYGFEETLVSYNLLSKCFVSHCEQHKHEQLATHTGMWNCMDFPFDFAL